MTFYPNLIIHYVDEDGQSQRGIYSAYEHQFLPTEVSENKTKATGFANELYIVPSKASLFIFDAHTDQNIAKLKLKGDSNNTLVYL